MGVQTKTHTGIYYGKANQFETGTSFPTSREMAEYIVGLDDGLEDGDTFYVTNNQVLGIRIGGSWLLLQFATA